MNIRQNFCSVSDLVADMQTPGGDETLLYQKCLDASDYLQKAIGWFIPVSMTKHLDGNDRVALHLATTPLLSLNSLSYQNVLLTENVDYRLRPEQRRWPFGPYTWVDVIQSSRNLQAWSSVLEIIPGNQPITPVTLDGKFGLYDRTLPTNAALTAGVGANDLALSANNGAAISPGCVILIDSEQMLVTSRGAPSSTAAALSAAVSDLSNPVISLTDASMIGIGEIIRVDFEQMLVLDKSGNALYVKRGWNTTTPVSHTLGASVFVYRIYNMERAINGTLAAAHNSGVTASRQVVPDDILFLTKEIATLMLNKSRSGYQGRTGNDQGVVFYNDAFPKADIERIKANYHLWEI